jgi:hypothetical protein
LNIWSVTPMGNVLTKNTKIKIKVWVGGCGGIGKREREGRETHGDDVGVAHDGIGESEREDDLELERRHVAVYGDLVKRI